MYDFYCIFKNRLVGNMLYGLYAVVYTNMFNIMEVRLSRISLIKELGYFSGSFIF